MTYSTQMKACLPSGQGLSLKNAAGTRLASVSGRIWLTMEGDSRYIELPAGGAHTIEHNGFALVKATERSLVQLSFPRTRLPAWKRLLRWLEAWFVSTGEARIRVRMNRGLYSWD
jgi:DUF2917 family protein